MKFLNQFNHILFQLKENTSITHVNCPPNCIQKVDDNRCKVQRALTLKGVPLKARVPVLHDGKILNDTHQVALKITNRVPANNSNIFQSQKKGWCNNDKFSHEQNNHTPLSQWVFSLVCTLKNILLYTITHISCDQFVK